eukprot:6990362-Pyramimonas_sp.AAC.1
MAPGRESFQEAMQEAPRERPRVQRYAIEEDLADSHDINGCDESWRDWDSRATRFAIACDCHPSVDAVMGRYLPDESTNAVFFSTVCNTAAGGRPVEFLETRSTGETETVTGRLTASPTSRWIMATLGGEAFSCCLAAGYAMPRWRRTCHGGRRGLGSTAAT